MAEETTITVTTTTAAREAAADRQTTRVVLLVLGLLGIVGGVALFGYGFALAHAKLACEARLTGLTVAAAARVCPAFLLWPFSAGGVIALVGALLVQFRDVRQAADVVRENVPLLGMLGGRRASDRVAAAVVAQQVEAVAVAPAAAPLPAILAAQDERGEEDARA